MSKQYQQYLIFGSSVIITALTFIYGFYQFDPTGRLAFDRRILHQAVQAWEFGGGMSNPPWSVAIIYPFEQLPLKLTWALLAFLLFTAIIAWLPPYKHWTRYFLLFFLPISFPTLRNYAEGNYEAFVLWGLLAIFFGYQKKLPLLLAFGVLLATIKLQACVVLIAMLPWYIRDWDWKQQQRFYLAILIWVIPIMLFFGKTWLDSLGYFSRNHDNYSIVALGLPFVLENLFRIFFVIGAIYVSPQLNRKSFSFLVATSLIIAPYSGALSTVILLAIAVTTLLSERKWLWGISLLILYQEIYIFGIDFLKGDAYIFGLFALTYAAFFWEPYREKNQSSNSDTNHKMTVSAAMLTF